MLGNFTPLRALIAQGEGLRLDFKQAVTSARKIAKTVAAFANTEGGKLLIGVKDNGRVVGCEVNEELYMVDSAAKLYCRPAVAYTHTVHEEKEKWVLEVDIPLSASRPHQAQDDDGKWLAYLRVHDQTQVASRVVLDLMRHQMGQHPTVLAYTETEAKLLEWIEAHGKTTLAQAIDVLRQPRRAVIDLLVKLLAVGVLVVETTQHDEYYSLAPIGPSRPPRTPYLQRH
jgi:predicted HTH transcriptional regulator